MAHRLRQREDLTFAQRDIAARQFASQVKQVLISILDIGLNNFLKYNFFF